MVAISALLALLLVLPGIASAQARTSFRVVTIGDTQENVGVDRLGVDSAASNRVARLISTINWVRDNWVSQGIGGLLGLGDTIDHECNGVMASGCGGNANTNDICNQIEWLRIRNAVFGPRTTFGFIDPATCDNCDGSNIAIDCTVTTGLNDSSLGLGSIRGLFYAFDRGNHDDEDNGNWSQNTMFGPTFYSGTPVAHPDGVTVQYGASSTFLGSFKDGNGASDSGTSTSFLVDLGGRRTLILMMGYSAIATESEGIWALSLVRARRHQPVIVVQHDGIIQTDSDRGANTALTLSAGTALAALAAEPNVRAVFAGHVVEPGEDAALLGGTGQVAFVSNQLQVAQNFQGQNPDTVAGACYGIMQYTAGGTISFTIFTADAANSAGCDDANAALVRRNWDQETTGALAYAPFDPAPCNMLVPERPEPPRAPLGC